MSLAKLLEEQQQRIDDLRRRIARDTVRDEDLQTASGANARRIDEVRARLERLQAGRKACLEKYDAEIEAQQELLRELEAGLGRVPTGDRPERDENDNDDGGGGVGGIRRPVPPDLRDGRLLRGGSLGSGVLPPGFGNR